MEEVSSFFKLHLTTRLATLFVRFILSRTTFFPLFYFTREREIFFAFSEFSRQIIIISHYQLSNCVKRHSNQSKRDFSNNNPRSVTIINKKERKIENTITKLSSQIQKKLHAWNLATFFTSPSRKRLTELYRNAHG